VCRWESPRRRAECFLSASISSRVRAIRTSGYLAFALSVWRSRTQASFHSWDAANDRRMKCLPRQTKSDKSCSYHGVPFAKLNQLNINKLVAATSAVFHSAHKFQPGPDFGDGAKLLHPPGPQPARSANEIFIEIGCNSELFFGQLTHNIPAGDSAFEIRRKLLLQLGCRFREQHSESRSAPCFPSESRTEPARFLAPIRLRTERPRDKRAGRL